MSQTNENDNRASGGEEQTQRERPRRRAVRSVESTSENVKTAPASIPARAADTAATTSSALSPASSADADRRRPRPAREFTPASGETESQTRVFDTPVDGTDTPAKPDISSDDNDDDVIIAPRNRAARTPTPSREIRTNPAGAEPGVESTRSIPVTRLPAKTAGTGRENAAGLPATAPKRENGVVGRPGNESTRPMNITSIRKELSGNENSEKKDKKNSSPDRGGNTVLSVIKAVVYITLVIVVGAVLGFVAIEVGNDVFAFVKSDEIVEVTIPEYATIDNVAQILGEDGIIKYPKLFTIYAKLKNDDGKFIAGTYQVQPSTNYDNLLGAFKYKYVRTIERVTIPEGYTVNEIIDLFLEKGMGTKEGFVDAINNYPYDYDFVKALDGNISSDRTYRLEGYLFPDTYEFYSDSSEVSIINKFLANFKTRFYDVWYNRLTELDMTMDQVITLASMIEKETKLMNQFENVSSVFHNRLNNPTYYPYLESDATIMYAIQCDTGERKTVLTQEDTKYDSPYNTYTNKGLPPGPIANPGYMAISSALYPESTDYYFFIANSRGEIVFSRTYAQHEAEKARINAGLD